MDRMVFDKLNYGLYVAGVFEGGRNYGCLISSFFQITSGSPQKCAIVLNRDNRTCEALLKAGTLTVSMAAQDASRELLSVFGYRSSRVADKFAGLPVQRDAFGNPYLTDRIAAWASLKVTETIPVKNYDLFICDAGYHYSGETIPEGYLCPLCRCPGGKFEKKRADGVLLRHRIGREASYVQHAGGLR